MRKSLLFVIALIIMAASIPAAASAAKQEDVTAVLVNGTKVAYAQAPITRDGTTLVSARETFKSLGLEFSWDAANRRLLGTSKETTLAVTLNQPTGTINGISVFLGSPAIEKNGRIMVPLRFLLDGVGASMVKKGTQLQVITGSQEKSPYYTALPLQITNTSVKNLGTETITVNYEHFAYDDEFYYWKEYSLVLAPKQKAAFQDAAAMPGDTITLDYEENVFLGRTIKSITAKEVDTPSKSYQKASNLYQSDNYYGALQNVFQKQWDDVVKYYKQELAKNKNVPLRIEGSNITYNSIGIPEANIGVTNLTGKRIIAMELSFSCLDSFGEPVNQMFTKSNRFSGRAQDISAESYESYTLTWTLNLFENCSKISNIKIDRVAYSDGTVWKRK
ncbi:stalk domain-containing protein [Paenibacillus nasutitermitis]|uniref:Copper amine oxidase-like N-terminal domain-containing protein n=1 Tax=Paenibacillus nasutitermitis TaxID=1652958 RepID=A0A916YJB1_9BACL|nr:stalk domain-containing protein [Paenibacillus nasutitermitis]GGD47911.1 hypothetical protein GCM10010911_01810 [Paenibacillus nasutitermitis]